MREDTDKIIFKKTWGIVVCALICNGLWGSSFSCIKLGCQWYNVETIGDKLLFAGMRFAIAGLMVIIFNSITNKKIIAPQNVMEVKAVFVLCAFQTVLQYLFFYIGLTNTSGVKSAIITGSNVFVAIVMACIISIRVPDKEGNITSHKEKLTTRILTGCIFGFTGIVLVNMSPEGIDGGFEITGEGFLLAATIAYGLSTLMIKHYSSKADTVMLSGWQFFVGGLILMLVGAMAGGDIAAQGGKAYVMLVYLGFISAVAYTLWGVLLKYNPVSRIAVFGFTNPVFGVILSTVLLNEGNKLNYKYVIALALVCVGIYLVNTKRKEE